jgi:hypothetical protein
MRPSLLTSRTGAGERFNLCYKIIGWPHSEAECILMI